MTIQERIDAHQANRDKLAQAHQELVSQINQVTQSIIALDSVLSELKDIRAAEATETPEAE